MGADKRKQLKCGEILLSLRNNKKSKVYIFNCAFCNEHCDQLKKFSLHLDEKHSKKFNKDDTLEPLVPADEEGEQEQTSPKADKQALKADEDIKDNMEMFVPEIKVEELMDIDIAATAGDDDDEIDEKKHLSNKKSEDENEDPLETNTKTKSSPSKLKNTTNVEVKGEKGENDSDDGGYGEDNTYEFSYELDYEDSVHGSSGSESEHSDEKKQETQDSRGKKVNLRKRVAKKQEEDNPYESSDDSRDSDFELEKGTGKTRVYRKKAKKTENILNVCEKDLTIAILAELEKHPVLWDIKDRSHDKIIRQNGFQQIAKEVSEKLQIQIKWEDIRKRITDIRYEYSREYDKQLKGDKCELPWYTEHMKFLKENIEVLIKHRYQKKKYRRLNSLEESHIPIIIEYYKNCEVLWQVTNIGFVVKPKKLEALKPIIQELKEKHNIDINIHDMQRRIDYINRIYSIDKEQQLKCEMENKEFVPSSKYYEELSFLSDSQGPFKCPHCQEIIQKYETYHIHLGEHTKTVPFKCALCEMRFNKLVKYIVHAKRHLRINNYHCDVCGKGYPFRAELDWHVREHTGEEPYLCEICGASFRSRHGYDNHIRRHEKRFRYECHICKYGFNHLHALNAHVKAHLNIRDILCNVCGKGFTAKKHLLRHQQIHSDIKRYKCGVCGKAFAQDAGLRAHKKQHVEYTSLAEIAKKEFRKGKYNYD
uniref:Protein krueppel n=1 Tax=Stomoxys calcitrans TaxID=35570 RepID=A0A1I8P283_STOCA